MLLVGRQEGEQTRVGFTVSRKVGRAVVRNRVKRRLKEIVRIHSDQLCKDRDHVLIASPKSASLDSQRLENEVADLLARARRWASQPSSSSPSSKSIAPH